MSSAVQILLITVSVLQLGMGISLNSCILVFSFKNLKNGLSLNPTNLIYSVKGLVNIFLLLVLTTENVIHVLWPTLLFIREVFLTLTFLILNPIYYSYWLTGWLCVHYCLSISNFTHKHLVGLKRVLSFFLPQVLLLSTIITFVMSVLSIWEIHTLSRDHPSTNSTQDAPSVFADYHIPKACTVVAKVLGCCLPFNLAMVSTGVTTSSLIRHMKKMKQNFSGNNGPNLQVLINTTRTMVLFLTLSAISYIVGLFFLSVIYVDNLMIISILLITPFPLIEAIIIIQAVPKLRKMIVGKVCSCTRWSMEREISM